MTEYSGREWEGYSQMPPAFVQIDPNAHNHTPEPFHPAPTPLLRDRVSSAPYPSHALGPLEPAAAAISELTAAPFALAAQSVLGAASLAAQALTNISLHQSAKPISCFFLSVAESGERKSGCDKLALEGVRNFESTLDQKYQAASISHKNAVDIYECDRRSILSGSRDSTDRRNDLEQLAPPPSPPLAPQLILTDPTIEGLLKHFEIARPSLGIFSDEGGQFLGGHGMNSDNKLKTGAAVSKLWDGSAINRTRAGTGPSVTFYGRRVSCHLMIQPLIAETLLGDATLRSQGLLSRMLIAWPESAIGHRFIPMTPDEAREDQLRSQLCAFHRRVADLLDVSFEGNEQELTPGSIRLSRTANQLFVQFSNDVEFQQADGNPCENVRGFASKTAEQAARLAGILQVFEDHHAKEIGAEHMVNGITLAEWYLSEARRLLDTAEVPPMLLKAEALRKWLQSRWDEDFINLRCIVNRGPNSIRNTDLARQLVAILERNGWLIREATAQTVNDAVARTCWRVVRS